MSKIIVKIRGGLGNQLFQYAFAKVMHKNLPESELILDVSYFNKKHIRDIDIDKYVLSANVKIERKPRCFFDLFYLYYRFRKRSCKNKGIEWELPLFFINRGYYFCDRYFDLSRVEKKANNMYLAGYFQQEKDIRCILTELRNELIPRQNYSNRFLE